MKFSLKYIFLIFSTLTLLTACEGTADNPEPPLPDGVSRTVLVYMAANNNPSLPHSLNYDNMVTAVDGGALDSGGRLIVFRKISSNSAPQLIELTKNGQKILKEYPVGTNTVDPETMKEVIADTRTIAPAAEYGLLLWSHASGWRSPARSWGQDVGFTGTEREMSIPDLAYALGNHQFRFIYMDCCFMGNIETLYELRDAADYIIASSTETPYAGMDYESNIPAFFEEEIDFKGLAANTYNAISNITRKGDECGISISLYEMKYIGAVSDVVKAIYASGTTRNIDISSIQQYGFSSWTNYFFDLRHYMTALTDNALLIGNLDSALAQFIPLYLHTDVLWKNQRPGNYPLIDVCGVSAFIPGSSSLETRYHYHDLQWYQHVVAPYIIADKAA